MCLIAPVTISQSRKAFGKKILPDRPSIESSGIFFCPDCLKLSSTRCNVCRETFSLLMSAFLTKCQDNNRVSIADCVVSCKEKNPFSNQEKKNPFQQVMNILVDIYQKNCVNICSDSQSFWLSFFPKGCKLFWGFYGSIQDSRYLMKKLYEMLRL